MRRALRTGIAALAAALCAGTAGAGTTEAEALGAAERLAAAIRFRTLTHQDPAETDPAPFRALHAFLAEQYPRTHAALSRETVNDLSLLYTWQGRDPSLAPALLTAHLDVVPAPNAGDWSHPPFAGELADGYVWGRGALDDKAGVLGVLEAVERLLAEGVRPARTLYLAFGHDEERGGEQGAGATAALLRERGVELGFTLDEGLAVVSDGLPGIDAPLALIGIAEKGYLTVRLVARAPGGHSSVPPRSTAIGHLAEAIAAVEASPLPASLDGPAGALLDALAPHAPAPMSWAFAGRRWLEPLLVWQLEKAPTTNALIRTTTAVTMVQGGVKENVLPPEAAATVNFRIAPGDSPASVLAHVREALAEHEIEIEPERGTEPSPVAEVDSQAWRWIAEALAEVMPDVVVAPGLVLGGTDTKHYVDLAENSYRFVPFRLGSGDLHRIHGVDERIAVGQFGEVIDFYAALLRRVAADAGP